MVRTTAFAAALLLGFSAPLGSDDFQTTVEIRSKAGKEWKVFREGLRGEEVWTSQGWTDAGLTDADAQELLQQRAADQGVLVGVVGWDLNSERHFLTQREFIVDGQFVMEADGVSGQSNKVPPGIRAYLGPHPGTTANEIANICSNREPDFTVPMFLNGLSWTVNGWRVRLPGKEEIIYYKGLRDDGVRTQDDGGF